MINMRKLLLISLISLSVFSKTHAQVGIGNEEPESSSTLDLSNFTNKGLLLPTPVDKASMSDAMGMLYFYDNRVYYRRSDAYNAISPWRYKFNGNISNDVFYNLGGNIGIGLSDITVSPLAPLHIETDIALNLVDDGSFIIGTTMSTNLAVNSSKIQTRNTGSASDLQINEQGGDVVVGSSFVPANVKVAGKIQELHQPDATYFDLMPRGSIAMWYGETTDIPTGWALCDGGDYARSDNNGLITTPDLSGRFVVGAGNNGESNYPPHAQGGEDIVTLSEDEMPSHNHSIYDPGHDHGYEDRYNRDEESDATNDRDVASDGYRTRYPDTDSAETGISLERTGGGESHENRPKYYTVVYMIKL